MECSVRMVAFFQYTFSEWFRPYGRMRVHEMYVMAVGDCVEI